MPNGDAGFVFDPTLNPDWTVGEQIAGTDSLRLETTLTEFDGVDVLLPDVAVEVPILLIVNPTMSTNSTITNTAEVSDATGPLGQMVIDVDSPMDTDPNNDEFTQDNAIDGNGLAGGDEDNSDPATIMVGGFDLALTKALAPDQATSVAPGDTITYDLTIINQGDIAADNIPVVDFIPEGLTLDMSFGNWEMAGSGDGFTSVVDTFTVADGELPAGGLQPGMVATVQIQLVLDAPFMSGSTLRNVAELGMSTDEEGNPQTDNDSEPADPNAPDDISDADDDNIDGDGTAGGDEDESDFADIDVSAFDLALTKELADGQSSMVDPGDTITYDLIIVNQGAIAADNIPVVDYIPDGLSLDMSFGDWQPVGSGDGFTSVSDTLTVADGDLAVGGLQPGAIDTVQIQLVLDAPFTGGSSLRNVAELGMSTNMDGNPQDDIDSEPADPNAPDDIDDADNDDIDGDGTAGGDEDESDFEDINVNAFDLALIKILADGQSRSVEAGDTVAFTIRVSNQGSVPADNIRVSDYFPSQDVGFTFDPSLNPDWAVYANIDNTTYIDNTLTEFDGDAALAPGAFIDVPVFLTVNPAMDATAQLTNLAEISDATDDFGNDVVDADSPMDTIPGNDNFLSNNDVNGDGTNGGRRG